jgi:hypothetical protein
MLFQLTTAGRSYFTANALLSVVTRIDFGSGSNYTLASNPTGLQGSVVYSGSTLTANPVAVDANTMRVTTIVANSVAQFQFGEVALYNGATLLGVGVATNLITKASVTGGPDYRFDLFLDTASTLALVSWQFSSSATRNFFPRIQTVDLLIPPAFDTNNAYVIYGDGDYNSAYLAYSDTSGRWSLSAKPRVWFSGSLTGISSGGASAAEVTATGYNGVAADLVIQFTSGSQRGICRRLSNITNGTVQWGTTLLSLPAIGDQYVILGPVTGSSFTGSHSSLAGVQGGNGTSEQYHLTQAEHDRVSFPKFKTFKQISASTYTTLDADDDAYIQLTHATPTITVNDTGFSTFPVGGMIMFRYINSAPTIQVAGGNTIVPANMLTFTTGTGTFAIVRTGVGTWDFLATVDDQPPFNGNMSLKFVANGGTNSLPNFVPMFDPVGTLQGPTATLVSSPLATTPSGGVKLWNGSLTGTTVAWDAPAFILVPLRDGPSAGSATGLANNTTSYTCAGTVNGISFSIAILGSAAQTYSSLMAAFNSQLNTALGSSTIASLTLNGYGLIFSTNAGGNSQSITLTNTNLFDSIPTLSTTFYRHTHSGGTGAVNDATVYLNYFDTPTNNNRIFRSGFGATTIGFQNSASGQTGAAVGGAYNLCGGNYSTIFGGVTNRVAATYCNILGGYSNVIIPDDSQSTWVPQFCTIENSDRSLVKTPTWATSTTTPSFNLIHSSQLCSVYGSFTMIVASKSIYSDNSYCAVNGSSNVTLSATNTVVEGSNGITVNNGSDHVTVVGSDTVTISGGKYVHMAGVTNFTPPAQSNVVYKPNSTTNVSGKPGINFEIATGTYGNGATLALTTDGQALSNTNRMVVPNGEAWLMSGEVVVNYPSGCKQWSFRAALKNVAGVVNIIYFEADEVGSILASNMTLSLAVGTTGNTDKVHFVVNSRNDVNSGYQQVSASARAVVTAARNLP